MRRDFSDSELTDLKQHFERTGYARVCAFLDPTLAEDCASSIGEIEGWMAVVSDQHANARYFGLDETPAELVSAARQQAATAFQFHFELRELTDGAALGLPLPWQALRKYIAAHEFRTFCAEVAGIPHPLSADGAISRISPYHFFGLHWDRQARDGKVRYLAYVLCPTRIWRADWGGATLLWNNKLDEAKAFCPLFNSLLLFSLPRPHSVEPVAPFMPFPRHMVSGFVYGPS